jgi:nicotinamide mononucleotide (NMN) deamidase PncC
MLRNRAFRAVLPPLGVAVLLLAALLAPVRPGSFNGILACYSYAYLCGVPTVTSVTPNTGSTSGGSSVKITGTNFNNSGLVVHFGTATATGASIDSDTQITATSPAHAAGTVDVTVTTAAGTSATTSADQFTYATVCNSVTISGAPPPSKPSGTQVVFTAVASGCPNAGPQFEFWMRAASQPTWQLIQAFSTTNTFNWDSTGAAVGIVYFGIWVKDASSTTATFDANSNIAYTITSPCASASITPASATVTQGSGAHDIITGGAAGCANSGPLFEFWLRTSSTDWILIQAFSTTATFDWNTTGAPPGVVYFGVWVKDAKSKTATFDANASATVTVNPAVCTTVNATALPTTVVHGSGTHSTITAVASGCTNGTGQLYEFWLRTTSTDWVLVQAYSTTATFNWNSTGAPVTTVYIGVWAKDKNSSTATFDANTNVAIPVT